MRRMLLVALACSGCVSDLAVGTSVRPIVEDAATPIVDASELDASVEEEEDASEPELDSGPPIIYFSADASRPVDAGSVDAEVYPVVCKPTLCTLFLVEMRCGDAGKLVCAQPSANETCQYLCL